MSKAERQALLLQLTREAGGFASLQNLAREAGVSLVTVRRDVREMAQAELVARAHGGIRLVDHDLLILEPSFLARSTTAEEAKRAIAQCAVHLVRPGATIMIDTGTTALAFAKALRNARDLTVVTTSLIIATTCADVHRVYMLPGAVRPGELSVVGPGTQAHLSNFQIDQAFIGLAGITDVCADYNLDDALVKRTVIQRSEETYALVDSTKFGLRATAVVCPTASLSGVITEKKPTASTFANDVRLITSKR